MAKSNKERRADLVARRHKAGQTRREYFLTDAEKKRLDAVLKEVRASVKSA